MCGSPAPGAKLCFNGFLNKHFCWLLFFTCTAKTTSIGAEGTIRWRERDARHATAARRTDARSIQPSTLTTTAIVVGRSGSTRRRGRRGRRRGGIGRRCACRGRTAANASNLFAGRITKSTAAGTAHSILNHRALFCRKVAIGVHSSRPNFSTFPLEGSVLRHDSSIDEGFRLGRVDGPQVAASGASAKVTMIEREEEGQFPA